jgi:hypothetical protein
LIKLSVYFQSQKLVYGGKLLEDSAVLRDVLRSVW